MSQSRELKNGFADGFEPVVPIDVTKTESVSDLLAAYRRVSFGGRTLGEGADTLERMIRDPACFTVCTLSGAMTVAKMGLVICEMIERGYIQAIVSTGALIAHGFVEGTGGVHFKYDQSLDDEALYVQGYDRIYDTLELEKNLDDIDYIVRDVIEKLPEETVLFSALIHKELGRYLDEQLPEDQRSILRSCYRHGVPVYVPAFTDSEVGLDLALLNLLRDRAGKPRRRFDPYLDLEHFARHVGIQQRTGIFTIGGGVPRNWAQQLGPLLDHLEKRMGRESSGFRYRYGLRVCPEPVNWGGLSGCTYSEGITWGKFVPPSEGGQFSEILADATLVWPLLIRAMIERLGPDPVNKDLRPPTTIDPLLGEASFEL